MNLAYEGKCEKSIDFWGMITDPIGEMIEMVAQLIMSAALSVFGNPMDIPSKNDATSYEIAGETRWIVVYLAIGSVLFAAVRMALERRGEAGVTAFKGVLRVLLVSSAASTVIGTFILLMDEYSGYLLKDALDKLMGGINCSSNVESMLLLVIGCLLLISAIIHTLLMWIRLGVMIMLMGTLPMAAAASMTDWGGTWWRKHLGWLIAWLLYKPTVALLIWSGSVMVDQSTADQTHTQIAGMGTLLLTAVALPALMRIIVPAVGALGGDSAGSATMGVAGGLASGAKSLAGPGGASGGGASGGSPSGPSGAGGGPGGQGSAGADGGPGSSGSGGIPGSGGGSGGGAGAAQKAGAANPALAAALGAAEVAGKVAKGAVDVARSGVEGANQDDGR